MALTEEQIRSQEIEALTGMPWWGYLIEDFENKIKEDEKIIFDIDLDDTLTHSLRSILIARRNCMKTMIEKPHKLLEIYKPQK